MDTFILAALALLGALAVIDLFVGVSNDAVNFLNSAVGSRTAPFWVIMTVASLGVLLGATFSSGMMEVARTGVLVPEHFTFKEVIIVFTAVMVCDVLLLNTFNSLGLPTSTTVSIVFELFGGATALACYKVWSSGAPIADLGLYLNSAKALAMIMAILVSVVVAFFAGLFVQYLLRLIFSFNYERYYKLFGGIYGGVSLTAVFYFLVIKGAKGASFMQPEWISWIDANTTELLLGCFAILTVLFQALIMALRINIFPIIILAGTFSLAFAFAGNDLVNFIGVPLAALIASATSLKLPLSTTYVTFMVAMGSSLADGAWDRESAVYRISGVLTVISGWFMTAFTAFTACGLICMLFISWGEPLQLIMMVLALIVVIRTNFFVKEEDETPDHERIDRGDKASIRDLLTESVNDNLNATLTLYAQGLQAFLDEDDQKLRELKGDAAQLFDFITMRRGEYYNMALEGGGSRSDRDARNFYYRAFTSMKEVSHSLRDQIGVAQNYVANSHSPFTGRMRDNIKTLSKRLIMIRDNFVPANCTQALELIDEAQRDFMTQIGEEKISLRKSELYLGYLLFAREVLNRYMMVKLLQSELEAGLAAQQQQQAAFAVEDDKDEPLQPSER